MGEKAGQRGLASSGKEDTQRIGSGSGGQRAARFSKFCRGMLF